MLKLFKIKGDSLFPLFKDKQLVLALKSNFSKLKIDDIVVFYQKDYGLMIKQIKKIKDNSYFLVGTVPHSIDSRNFGYIPKEDISYKVIYKVPFL